MGDFLSSTDPGLRLQSLGGLIAFCAIAWALSEDRRRFPWRMALGACAFQAVVAGFLLYTPGARDALAYLNVVVEALQKATNAGGSFVFGYLGGGPTPFDVSDDSALFILGFQGLPLVIFISALAALLWHAGVLRVIVGAFAATLERAFGVGGAVALSTAANVLMGPTEAPLLIRAYLSKISRSEFFVVMTGGLATVAGTVMVLYSIILGPVTPSALGHVIVASIISAASAILMARIMVPPERDETPTDAAAGDDLKYGGAMDAFMTGVTEGLKLYLNIVACLIAFVAMAALINICLSALGDIAGAPMTLQRMFGWIFAPLVWLAGVPASEAAAAGALMGEKTALNELIAYVSLARTPDGVFSPRTELIMIYSLCGFASFGSLGIVVGGLTAIAPERRQDVLELGPRSLVSSTLATLMSGSIIGLIWVG
ncbi:MAG: nucleoside:proton symporter [Alphaproteobacteria bacterium]|nr:nucleoside:proton symporter [Alphaproteobacteria bacterium]